MAVGHPNLLHICIHIVEDHWPHCLERREALYSLKKGGRWNHCLGDIVWRVFLINYLRRN